MYLPRGVWDERARALPTRTRNNVYGFLFQFFFFALPARSRRISDETAGVHYNVAVYLRAARTHTRATGTMIRDNNTAALRPRACTCATRTCVPCVIITRGRECPAGRLRKTRPSSRLGVDRYSQRTRRVASQSVSVPIKRLCSVTWTARPHDRSKINYDKIVLGLNR